MSRPLTRPPERSTAGGEREKNGSASSALGQSLHEAAIQPRLDGRFFFLPRRRGGAEDPFGGWRPGRVGFNCSTRKHERTKGSDPGLAPPAALALGGLFFSYLGTPRAGRAGSAQKPLNKCAPGSRSPNAHGTFRAFVSFVLSCAACHAVRPRTRPPSAPPRLRGSKPNIPHSHQSALPLYARRRSSCQMPRELIGSAPVKLSGSAMASDMLVALALALSA